MIGPNKLGYDTVVNPDDPNEMGVTNPYVALDDGADQPSPYDQPAPDKPQTQAPDAQAPAVQDPTKNDPGVQKYQQRLDEIDQELKNRPGSIGGILASFSPSGDPRYQELHNERNAIAGSMNNAEKNAIQFGKSRFQKVGSGGAMVDTATGQPIYQNTTSVDVVNARGQNQLAYAQQLGLNQQDVQKLRNVGVQLTGDWHRDVAAINATAHITGIGQQQAGANARNTETVTGRSNVVNAQIAAGAGKTATQSDNDQLNSLTKAAHEALAQGDGQTAATLFKEAQTIRQRMTTRSTAPPPQVATPGVESPATKLPTGAVQPAQGVKDGTTGGGGKYIAHGGFWYPAPSAAAPDQSAPMVSSH